MESGSLNELVLSDRELWVLELALSGLRPVAGQEILAHTESLRAKLRVFVERRAVARDDEPSTPASSGEPRALHLQWSGVEWVDSRCGCRYHPDDDSGSHGGSPHIHPCARHAARVSDAPPAYDPRLVALLEETRAYINSASAFEAEAGDIEDEEIEGPGLVQRLDSWLAEMVTAGYDAALQQRGREGARRMSRGLRGYIVSSHGYVDASKLVEHGYIPEPSTPASSGEPREPGLAWHDAGGGRQLFRVRGGGKPDEFFASVLDAVEEVRMRAKSNAAQAMKVLHAGWSRERKMGNWAECADELRRTLRQAYDILEQSTPASPRDAARSAALAQAHALLDAWDDWYGPDEGFRCDKFTLICTCFDELRSRMDFIDAEHPTQPPVAPPGERAAPGEVERGKSDEAQRVAKCGRCGAAAGWPCRECDYGTA